MNLEALERFVMDTIDLILNNPSEYEAEAVKSTVAYRFTLHRGYEIKVHAIDPKLLDIEKPKIHRLPIARAHSSENMEMRAEMINIKKYVDHPFFGFYKAMIHEYERHEAEKGDSWKNCKLDYLTEHLNKVGHRYFKNTANESELIDMANMEAMIWLRFQDTLDKLEKVLEAT